MRKFKLLMLVILIGVFLSGCSGNNALPKRAHDANADVIKFYNLDWLTSKNDVDARFTKDFGEGTYTTKLDYFEKANDTLGFGEYYYKGVDGDGLHWNIGGHEVSSMVITYISNDECKNNYLIRGKYSFKNPTEEVAQDLYHTLCSLYSETKRTPSTTEFEDINGNRITMRFYKYTEGKITATLSLEYMCGDMINAFNDIQESYYKQKTKEGANGL